MVRSGFSRALLALAVPAVLVLPACAPGGGTPADKGTGTGVVTDPAAMGNVTLTLVDFWQDAEGDWMDKSVAAFEAKYPNLKVQRTVQEWTQIMDTLPLRLSDDSSPDVVTANNGWQSIGTLAKGGLIVNLDPYATAYGWDTFLPSTIKRQLTFTTDGKTMGSGALWAAPSARVQTIGIYYDKKLLEQAGVAAPTTLEEFESALATLKSAGITPIAYGGTDKPTTALFALWDVLGDRDAIADATYGTSDVQVGPSGLLPAAQLLKKWGDAGYLTANYDGLAIADANAKFLAGDGAFDFYYSGLVPTDQANRSDFGYLQLVQAKGGKMVATGAPADNLVISARSKHKDAAALLLDFLMSEQAAQITADAGYMPLLHDATIPQDDPLIVQEAGAAQATEADNGYVPYFDWSTPTMLDTLGSQAQVLLAGRATPQDLVDAVQADLEAFRATQQ
ncbi:MAG: extracellular solute-binding protein [Micrococcales bacterium]|nr:extracellular solute-binding protein [Micrococcales bacterium]